MNHINNISREFDYLLHDLTEKCLAGALNAYDDAKFLRSNMLHETLDLIKEESYDDPEGDHMDLYLRLRSNPKTKDYANVVLKRITAVHDRRNADILFKSKLINRLNTYSSLT